MGAVGHPQVAREDSFRVLGGPSVVSCSLQAGLGGSFARIQQLSLQHRAQAVISFPVGCHVSSTTRLQIVWSSPHTAWLTDIWLAILKLHRPFGTMLFSPHAFRIKVSLYRCL